ncbi:pilus assembly protein [Hydrogenophaga sp.]|uniref:pilus assembly protein n=1 Tax=Hydrogenophaga sp. TaxID=1904254 RepID=UPI002718AD19|nr:PilC/PilY family type IV pilus protein [Hydrogenophaga sp.]MDO8906344.1 PilC/PilY family type IV pilus protein [Hydrogenophaga sp.]
MTHTLRSWIQKSLLCLGLALSGGAQAQYTSDIDIYSASGSGEAPNVLFVLDNTANWSQAFEYEIAALIDAFNALPVNRFRVGFMLFTETGGDNNNTAGGYVRSAIRPLDADYRNKLGAMLSGLDRLGDRSSGGKAGITMAEAYYYLAGKAPYAGNGKAKTDFTGNTVGNAQSQAIYSLPGNALASKNANRYNAPSVGGTCDRSYIIYISNGAVQDNTSDTALASEFLDAAYREEGLTRPPEVVINGPTGSATNKADEWARFMRQSSLGIATYTIDVNPVRTGQGPGWTALLKSMAAVSGGEYFAVNSGVGGGEEIQLALSNIFNQMLAADSVFASASLPASTNARGSYKNQVYFGTFRPDQRAAPRWRGNLKQYKFSYDPTTDTLALSDANDNPAVTGATGFFSPSAESYWSTASTFWSNQLIGTPPSASDLPDGEVVEKGGVAQRIRIQNATTQANRRVFTCVGCGSGTNLATNASAEFASGNTAITSAGLAVPDATSRTALINWVRGTDNRGDELGPGGATTIRPSVHGDVLHARPAVVDYGGSTGVVVYYGSNDGMMRAVNGNNDANGGNELWGFVPQEHFPRLKRLYDNSPAVRLSTSLVLDEAAIDRPTPRDYFVDGPISVYQKLNAAGVTERAILYFGMRRGGRFLYALDVTNPLQPRFLWKKTNANIARLGQTWSEARVARIRGNTNPVLIMGGGYDAVAEDAATPGTTTMGNAVLVLDAFSGELLKSFETDRSVPADVAIVDSDADGYVDRAYAVDVGGNIYRIDFEKDAEGDVDDWEMYKLAALAGGNTRKFLYPPDVVVTRQYTAVMAGSGDREKPLATTSADAFFTVFDRNTSKVPPLTTPTAITATDLAAVGSTADATQGCYLSMDVRGEKIVNAPVTVGGITYFSTNRPLPATECRANLGQARVYAAPLFCTAPQVEILTTGGLPPSAVAGTVEVTYTQTNEDGTTTEGQKRVPFIIGGINPKGSPIEATKVNPLISPQRKRSYWYLENAR